MQLLTHPEIKVPSDDTLIWRYVDLVTLVAMLSSQSLSLTRSDKFPNDPWEGQWPNQIREVQWARSNIHHYAKEDENQEAARKTYFVNCWHENKAESDAFWRLYAKDTGLAIRTTVGHLKASIRDTKEIYLGKVDYLDFKTEKAWSEQSELRPLPPFRKRASFVHENEIRLLYLQPPRDIKGEPHPVLDRVALNIDCFVLIQDLYISPFCKAWQADVIEEVCKRFLLKISPVRSDLNEPYVSNPPRIDDDT